MKVIAVKTSIPDLVERLNSLTEFINKYVVGRTAEIEALRLCLLTKHHLLLEGPPGVAKSRFARLFFKAFEGVNVFQTMFHGATLTDDVFGPPNAKLLREQGIMQYNTTGMLPEAHFAYLDELFNGPPTVLNAALNTLNERIFQNGGKTLACPLMTAVATTNKVSDNEELSAFLDRFLITLRCEPADSESARLSILTAFLEAEDIEDIDIPEKFTLKELNALQAAVKKVAVPREVVELMECIRSDYVNSTGRYVSDRRFCWLYRAIQASILFESHGEFLTDPDPSFAQGAMAALSRNPKDIEVINNNFAGLILRMGTTRKEQAEFRDVEARITKLIGRYEPSMTAPALRRLLDISDKALNSLKGLPADQQYTDPMLVQKMRQLISKLENFVLQLKSDLGL